MYIVHKCITHPPDLRGAFNNLLFAKLNNKKVKHPLDLQFNLKKFIVFTRKISFSSLSQYFATFTVKQTKYSKNFPRHNLVSNYSAIF